MIKIQHGTAPSDAHLCRTCVSSVIARGHRLDEEVIYCHALERDITFPIHSCTQYRSANAPSLRQMQEDAIYIDINKKTNRIGFKRYDELPDEEKWRSLE